MSSPLRFGRAEVRPTERQLLIDGQPAALGARAFDLLLALIEHRDRVVQKNELLDLVWPGLVVEENNLQVQISALRKLLGPQAISTIPGRGYRFALPMDESSARASVDDTALAQPALPRDAARGNLPLHLPPVIGRDTEFRELLKQFESSRLVTVTGAGGMGKTTLALAVARALQGNFKDGAWLIELAPVSDPSLVAQTVAQALRIAVTEPSTAQQRLIEVLASQHVLLVLDNSEYVADAIGRLALALTAHAPQVRVLTTSQKLLNIPGETVLRLGPLATPVRDQIAAIEHFGAIRLFVERVRAAQQDFAVTPSNADAVAEICRRLDGMPLALELAAARVRLFGVHRLQELLDERFKLLTGGSHAVAPRHQALLTTIDWSHGLLSDHEQAVLRRLSVFVGGFSLELAQRVACDGAADAWAVIDALSTLVDRSLVQVDSGEPARYRLLESTRAYALERLTQSSEMDETLRRHADAVRDLFVEAEEARFGENGSLTMAEFMQELSPELGNFRAAFDWSVGQGDDIDTAIALAASSGMFFRWLGRSHEGLENFLPLRTHIGEVADRSRQALFWSALLYLGDGRIPAAEILDADKRAVAAFRAGGQRRRLYQGLYGIGWSLSRLSRNEEATAVVEEMRQIERSTDPPWLRALRLNLAGTIYLTSEEFEAAVAVHVEQRQLVAHAVGEEVSLNICQNNLCAALNCLGHFDEAIAVAQSTIERSGGHPSTNLVFTMFHILHSQLSLGRLDEAELTMRQAMPEWRRDEMVLFGASHLAMLLAEQGRLADAARVDGAARAYARRGGSRPSPVRLMAHRRTLELFEAGRVDPIDVARWQREGETLDENAVAALCMAT